MYICRMKVIENTIVPDELTGLCFACDVNMCKGACCVEGDAGAPLTERMKFAFWRITLKI